MAFRFTTAASEPYSVVVNIRVQPDPPPPGFEAGFLLMLFPQVPMDPVLKGYLEEFVSTPVADDAEAFRRSAVLDIDWNRADASGPGPLRPIPTMKPLRTPDGILGWNVTFTDPGVGNVEDWFLKIRLPHTAVAGALEFVF